MQSQIGYLSNNNMEFTNTIRIVCPLKQFQKEGCFYAGGVQPTLHIS